MLSFAAHRALFPCERKVGIVSNSLSEASQKAAVSWRAQTGTESPGHRALYLQLPKEIVVDEFDVFVGFFQDV